MFCASSARERIYVNEILWLRTAETCGGAINLHAALQAEKRARVIRILLIQICKRVSISIDGND